jgi:hypothetical protein
MNLLFALAMMRTLRWGMMEATTQTAQQTAAILVVPATWQMQL